jgi:uncharacterized DUF497 family protein
MGFQWDQEKSAANETKHGISFIQAAQVFRSPILKALDDRRDYGDTSHWAFMTAKSCGLYSQNMTETFV